MKKVILLNSGGPDCGMLASKLKNDGFDVVSLFVNTHQLNSVPTGVSAQQTANLFCSKHIVHDVDWGGTSNYFYNQTTGDFKLFDQAPELEDTYQADGYVLGPTPNHTMMFIAIGIGYAIREGATEVYLGLKTDVFEDADWLKVSTLIPESKWKIPRVAVLAPLRDIVDGSYSGVAQFTGSNLADFTYTHSCIHAVPCDGVRPLCFKCEPRETQGL